MTSISAITQLPETQPSQRRGETGARAPGKLILTGEHAVVYGRPALAVAVQHYTEIWFTPLHKTDGLRTAFESLTPGAFYPFDVLRGFKEGLDRRFDAFINGKLPVQKILRKPDDLAIYALTSLLPNLPVPGGRAGFPLPVPGQLRSQSEMPLGSGMGSSAAVVAATVVLYEHLLGRPQTLTERFEKVRFCERLQHGRGSAIDASAVVFGGLNRVQGDQVDPIALGADHPLMAGGQWYWVQTGTPQSSTGECVAAVREAHGQDTALWTGFENCTDAFEVAIRDGDDPTAVVRENHRLLDRIGVVPNPARRFVAAVEALGGAAKISGAGGVRGDRGGVVLVYLNDTDKMTKLMDSYPDYRWSPLRVATDGAALITPTAGRGQ